MTDYQTFCQQSGLEPDSQEAQQRYQAALAALETQLESAMEALHSATADLESQTRKALTTLRSVVAQAEAEDAIEQARYQAYHHQRR